VAGVPCLVSSPTFSNVWVTLAVSYHRPTFTRTGRFRYS